MLIGVHIPATSPAHRFPSLFHSYNYTMIPIDLCEPGSSVGIATNYGQDGP